jgi:hypothetical protein
MDQTRMPQHERAVNKEPILGLALAEQVASIHYSLGFPRVPIVAMYNTAWTWDDVVAVL